MQHHTALEKLSDVLENALAAVKDKKLDLARDCCMQGFALIDLICATDFGYASHFNTCRTLLNDIICNLSLTNKEDDFERSNDPGRSLVSDEDSSCQHEDKMDDEEEVSLTIREGFRSVIGCEQAKSSLLENVILPMTHISGATFSNIFQGAIVL